jgi:polysaccharide pyruvyl transferase WcaK-like protein
VLIEIKGVQFVNKGAALMLQAIVDRLRQRLPGVEFALAPGANASFRDIAAAGAWQRLRVPGAPLDVDSLSYRLPARIRVAGRRYGIVTEADVDAVLDASGFAYGSTWGDVPLTSTAREIERLSAHRKPYLFLPQAFGPFESSGAARQFGRALGSAALVCAREPESRQHVESIAGPLGDRLAVFPDFTIGLTGLPEAAARHGVDRKTALLIPNVHMQDARNPDVDWRSAYVPLMASLGKQLAERGYAVRVLNHEGAADGSLCESLRQATTSAAVITEVDPRALKGVIGGAGFVVSSRYHGCVNALSQAVPCLGTAWSHKYAALFDDFGMRDCLLSSSDADAACRVLDAALDSRDALAARLAAARPALEARIDAMWQRVFAALGSPGPA